MEPVKIIFICSSLEPGYDGVGDYTRKLAAALINKGNSAAIIALNDRRFEDTTALKGEQENEGTYIPVLRLSSTLPWQSRIEKAQNFVKAFEPDWLSLQYVPFGYHIKGIPFTLGKRLKKITGHCYWHIMFHELSVNKNESFKFRVWAFMQMVIIRCLMKILNPQIVSTNTEVYKYRLEKMGYTAELLPLFSNISRKPLFNDPGFHQIIPECLLLNRCEYIIGTLFASFSFKTWNLHSLLEKLSSNYAGKKIMIVSIGKMPAGIEQWELLKQQHPDIKFYTLGPQPETFISAWLSCYTDFGILTTPAVLAGKSGSFMAFKEHGIPVVCKQAEKKEYPINVRLDKCLTVIKNDKTYLTLPVKYKPMHLLGNVAGQFLQSLKNHKAGKKIKILMLSHRFNPDVGGIESNSEILASFFHSYGADVHVMTWTKEKSKEAFPFSVIRDPDLKTILKQHRWADIIFENNPCLRMSWPNFAGQKPFVIALNTWVKRTTGNKGLQDRLKQLWFHKASGIIAVSDALRKREWPQAIVIENPYNDHLFKRIRDIKKNIPFVFLGRLVSDKGADMAIKAISVLIREQILNKESVQLTIIGDGPESNRLKALIRKLKLENIIELTGIMKEKNLVECLNQHHFILVPSVWEEPYGNVVLEGMACGCVPIASNGGGLPEAVGDAGILFKRNDLDDLVHCMKSILADPLKAEILRNKGEAHLDSHLQEIVAARYFKILSEAAGFTARRKKAVPIGERAQL